MSSCKVHFYSMDGCGYCAKAKTMFKDQIASGEMCVLPASQAPPGVTGFPHFVSAVTKQSHTGLPPSLQALMQALGHTEPFRNRCVVPQRRPEPFRQQPRASVWQKQYM